MRSLLTGFAQGILAFAAVVLGLLAAFYSQASSPDYSALLLFVAGISALSVVFAYAFAHWVPGRLRLIPIFAAALGVVGTIELALRVTFS